MIQVKLRAKKNRHKGYRLREEIRRLRIFASFSSLQGYLCRQLFGEKRVVMLDSMCSSAVYGCSLSCSSRLEIRNVVHWRLVLASLSHKL